MSSHPANGGAQLSQTDLPPELRLHVLSLLPPNDLALGGRLSSKDAAQCFNEAHSRTASLSQPLPAYATASWEAEAPAELGRPSSQSAGAGGADWQPHLQQAVKKLCFKEKFSLLSAAAASGSEANLEVAWRLLRPCIYPELLSKPPSGFVANFSYIRDTSAGPAAVRAGHLHVLPWLLRHGCPLNHEATLVAVAQHCDLASLQHVWELLGFREEGGRRFKSEAFQDTAEAAGLSSDGARAKVSWLLSVAGPAAAQFKRGEVLSWAAVGAAARGNLPVLKWLLEQGADPEAAFKRFPTPVLGAALEHGHLAVADWLVDQAGCLLPPPKDEEDEYEWNSDEEHDFDYLSDDDDADDDEEEEDEDEVKEDTSGILWVRATRRGSLDAMRWLLGRGVPAHQWALEEAAEAGQLQAAQFLHDECGLKVTKKVLMAAAGSRSLPTAQWLLQAAHIYSDFEALKERSITGFKTLYAAAVEAGDVKMIEWLLTEFPKPNTSYWAHLEGVWGICTGRAGTRCSKDLEQAAKMVVKSDCPPEAAVPLEAATRYGHLGVLRWLHEQKGVSLGCAGQKMLHWAVQSGCEALLEWLVAAGCQPRKGECYYDVPLRRGDLATLSCLRRLQVPLVLDWARHPLPLPLLPALRLLLQQGVPVRETEVAAIMRVAPSTGEGRQCAAWLEGFLAGQRSAGQQHSEARAGWEAERQRHQRELEAAQREAAEAREALAADRAAWGHERRRLTGERNSAHWRDGAEASWPTAPAASCDAASGTAPVLTAAAAAATTSAVAFTATPVPPPSAPFGNTEATAAGEEGQGEDEGEAREGGSRAAHLPERPDACAAGCAAAAAGPSRHPPPTASTGPPADAAASQPGAAPRSAPNPSPARTASIVTHTAAARPPSR